VSVYRWEKHRNLIAALRQQLDMTHDSVRVYRISSARLVDVETLGVELDHSDSVL